MERVQKKESRKAAWGTGTVKMTAILGNQSILQMQPSDSESDFDDEWVEDSEDLEQIKRDKAEDRMNDTQYLNSSVLRTNLGQTGNGGEAHHVIPSCVAQNRGLDADECNKSWNGILLPGGPTKNLLSKPQDHPATLPNHMRSDTHRDHPNYNKKVLKMFGTSKNIAQAKVLAAGMKLSIESYGADKCIDDM